MISFKGRLSFLQYLQEAPSVGMGAGRCGEWLYMGVKVVHGEGEEPDGLAHHVVVDLVDDVRLLSKGYVIVMDNFYCSPALFHDLIK